MPVRSIKPRVRPGHESGCALLLRSGKSRHPKPWRPCSATLSRPSPSMPWKASSGRLFAPPPYWSAPIANYDASSGKHAVSPVSAEPKWPSTYRPSGSMLVGPRRRRLGGRLPVRSFLTGSICTLNQGYATSNLFLTHNQSAAASKDRLLLAITAGSLKHDKPRRTAFPAAFANMGYAHHTRHLLADAQLARILILLLTVDQLHLRAIQFQAGKAHPKRGWKRRRRVLKRLVTV